MDGSVLDAPAMDTSAMEAVSMAEPPPELEGYADMAGLEEGQQVMLQLPGAERAGTESVIMEVVRVDGNQIHFITPDTTGQRDAGTGEVRIKTEATILRLPEGAQFADTNDDDAEELEEVEAPCCFLCLEPTTQSPLHSLILSHTEGTACSLAERLSSCAAPLRLDVSTADAVCEGCLSLINMADQYYHQYQLASQKITELVQAGSDHRRSAGDGIDSHTAAAAAADDDQSDGEQEEQAGAEERELPSPLPPLGDDSDDSDWAPGGPPPRSSRSRVPKVRRRWSPEPIERPAPPPPPPAGTTPRGRGRPRKYPIVPPTIIEYTDIDTLKEQVKDIKTPRFNLKSAQPKRPLKADLEKIIHLEVRSADSGTPAPLAADDDDDDAADDDDDEDDDDGGVAPAPAPRRGRPPAMPRVATSAYECRRCDIEFQDSTAMVNHLRQHVNKPWCKRCRTEFPHRQAMLDHRRACRLRHRSGECAICNREVKYYRYHMRRHTDLVEQGVLEEGAPILEEEDHPPPSVQRRVGKFLAGGVCSICGEHVPEKLRKHERSHNITHTCPICKKVFTREDVVRGHIKRVHMKERPHVCAQCGKTFVSVYSLQRHDMIHNNEYRFYCQECGDGFRQKQQLTAHMRHKHGVVDVVFEDVQVMPEGSGVVDALSVITQEHGTVYEGGVLEPGEFDKEEYVITAAADEDDQHVQFTAVTDADGNLHLEG